VLVVRAFAGPSLKDPAAERIIVVLVGEKQKETPGGWL